MAASQRPGQRAVERGRGEAVTGAAGAHSAGGRDREEGLDGQRWRHAAGSSEGGVRCKVEEGRGWAATVAGSRQRPALRAASLGPGTVEARTRIVGRGGGTRAAVALAVVPHEGGGERA